MLSRSERFLRIQRGRPSRSRPQGKAVNLARLFCGVASGDVALYAYVFASSAASGAFQVSVSEK